MIFQPTPWRPDRYQLRECPEPGIAAAIYYTNDLDQNHYDPRQAVKGEHETRSERSNIRAARTGTPSTGKAEEFAARYLRQHPYLPPS